MEELTSKFFELEKKQVEIGFHVGNLASKVNDVKIRLDNSDVSIQDIGLNVSNLKIATEMHKTNSVERTTELKSSFEELEGKVNDIGNELVEIKANIQNLKTNSFLEFTKDFDLKKILMVLAGLLTFSGGPVLVKEGLFQETDDYQHFEEVILRLKSEGKL